MANYKAENTGENRLVPRATHIRSFFREWPFTGEGIDAGIASVLTAK
jgi:hypothetical protein